MAFRVSFFWTIQQKLIGGWSENFWNGLADLSDVEKQATALRGVLNSFHATQVKCPTVRISDTTGFRQVKILTFNLNLGGGQSNTNNADFVNTAALLKLQAGPKLVTRQWLRGLDDDDINQGGYWNPTAATVSQVNKLRALLTSAANGWVLRKLKALPVPTDIVGITQAGIMTVQNIANPGGIAKLRISRCISNIDINRIWKFQWIDATHVQLLGPVPFTVAPVFVQLGTAKVQEYEYTAITDSSIERATSRRTGRPLGQSSGRRRTRKRVGAGLPVVQ